MNEAPESFGLRLRRTREARGLSLDSIATSTKIKKSLLAALERNDVSQWPAGLFRRAFIREYAAAIGLPPEPTVAEFSRAFPEPGQDPLPDGSAAPEAAGGLRLTLAETGPLASLRTSRHRTVAALLDTGLLIAVGGIGAAVAHINLWEALAVVALCYSCASTLFGGSVAASVLLRIAKATGPRQQIRFDSDPVAPVAFDLRELLPLTSSHPASQVWRPQ